jgi:hypothetical protein
MNKIPLKQGIPHAWRGGSRPAAVGAALAALLAFTLIAPTAWTEMGKPGTSVKAGENCQARAEPVAADGPREVATDAQFMQWAMAAHRSATGASSFTALAAARTLSQDNHN